jgi:DNA-binding GntR family transcriptional regulator
VEEAIGVPAYRRLAASLRAQIARGDLSVGDAIPSTAQLCAAHGVSATVVRAAVAQLQAEGLLRGQPGKAVYVVATPKSIPQTGAQLETMAQEVAQLQQSLTAVMERTERVTPDDLDKIRSEIAELRKMVGVLQAHLIELYARTGHNYPRDSTTHKTSRAGRKDKAAG